MPTPLATCAGRRLLRDMSERPELFKTVSDNLSYILHECEPAYQAQVSGLQARLINGYIHH